MRESDVVAEILTALGADPKCLIWKNPTGVARALSNNQVVRYGLPGSPDIIGALAVTIRPEHVGQTWGRAIGIEVKTDRGQQEELQKRFEAAWTQRVNGLYVIARSAADARSLIEAVS
jgi:hypothetical protein